MAQQHPKPFKVLVPKVRQGLYVDTVVSERLRVLAEAKAINPQTASLPKGTRRSSRSTKLHLPSSERTEGYRWSTFTPASRAGSVVYFCTGILSYALQ